MLFGEHAYEALLGFGFGGTLIALFMRVAAVSIRKPQTSAPISLVKSKKIFRRVIRATQPQLPITSVITSATAPVWQQIFSKAMKSPLLPQ